MNIIVIWWLIVLFTWCRRGRWGRWRSWRSFRRYPRDRIAGRPSSGRVRLWSLWGRRGPSCRTRSDLLDTIACGASPWDSPDSICTPGPSSGKPSISSKPDWNNNSSFVIETSYSSSLSTNRIDGSRERFSALLRSRCIRGHGPRIYRRFFILVDLRYFVWPESSDSFLDCSLRCPVRNVERPFYPRETRRCTEDPYHLSVTRSFFRISWRPLGSCEKDVRGTFCVRAAVILEDKHE